MKKLLSLATVAMLSVFTAFAGEVTITMADFADQFVENSATQEINAGDIQLLFDKQTGSTNPTINAKTLDARLYAKGTLTVTAKETITSMVFNLSVQGLRRATEITPSVGECAVDTTAKTVTWTGAATEVVLTVGEKAVYGSDGAEKAGQFDFVSIDLVIDGEVTPIDPGQGAAVPAASEWEFNFAQGVYLSNYLEELYGEPVAEHVWEIDLIDFIGEEDYDLNLSFGIETASATSVAGTYDLSAENIWWAEIEAVDGTDTATVQFVGGTLTLSRLANDELGYVYRVVLDAVGDDGKEYKYAANVPFDYFYDGSSDADIEMTDEIGVDALEVVDAANFVTVVDGNLVVSAEGNVQVYNVAGHILYNGAANTISCIQRGQILIVRNGSKVAKVVL